MKLEMKPSIALIAIAMTVVAGGCSGSRNIPSAQAETAPAPRGPLPGMPPVLDPLDIYAADRAGHLARAVSRFPSLIYVPNSVSNTVDIIDPKTFTSMRHLALCMRPP